MSIHDWKFDVHRAGYVNQQTGAFVSWELYCRSGTAYRASELSRRFGAFAGIEYTFHRLDELAAQKATGDREPCPVCDGSGAFRHCLSLVPCSVCAGSGRYPAAAETGP